MTITNKIAFVGQPGQLLYKQVPIPTAQDDSIVIKNHLAGVNYADIFHLAGTVNLTGSDILGLESVGEVVAVGKNVTQYKVGDRVVNIAGFSFAEYSEIPSAKFYRVTHLPDDISYETAIGLGLQALTAYTLAFKDYAVQKGDYFLVHAAAGGVGLLLTQLLRYLGGTVIGTVSSQEKADVAKQFGAHYTIDYTKEDIAERIKKITNEGVHVVYDSVGKSVYDANIDSLRPFGVLVHYGFASGAIDKGLSDKFFFNSLRIQASAFPNHIKQGDGIHEWWYKLFDMSRSGALKTHITKTYTLDQVSLALEDIGSRKSTGKLIIKL